MSNDDDDEYKDKIEIRNHAESIADEIKHKVANYLRYKADVWIKEGDYLEIKRIVKSILVQRGKR